MAEDIAQWLDGLGLGQYAPAFAENDIDLEILPHLMDEDLERLGLSLGHMRKLQVAIKALSADELPSRPAAPPARDAEPQPAEAERRQLTVMFCDLVGSTALSGALDPEDYREVMRAYQEAGVAMVRRYDGYVAKYLGDGLLVYFGYPQAHEDDAERAVRAGLAMVDAISALTARPDLRLQVRIGIATGLVVVGDMVGAGVAEEWAVSGETPNLAARLQALAAPDTVVISAGTKQLLGGQFDYEDIGVCRLKGITEPVQVWRVVGERFAESRFEAARAKSLTTFVSRDREMVLLLDRWAQAKNGAGQVVLLSGEAGIGKSRITQALRERLAGEPHTQLRYQCSPYHTNSALYPSISQLAHAARFAPDDSTEQKLNKLEALLTQSTEAVQEVAPLFAALLSIPTGDRYPPLNMTPQRQKRMTLEALVSQLVGLAARQPVLFILEDVHWIDPTTLEFTDLVIDRLRDSPVLLVITFRPEFAPPWTGHAHITSLALNRLDRRQSAEIVESVTGGKAIPAEMLDQIVSKTDGVPLFIEELTRTVLESGLLREEPRQYVLEGPLPQFAIPATLQDSLMARLDRLAAVKEVAQIGAAIGRRFTYHLLAAVASRDDNELQDSLNRLTSSELIFRRGTPPEATYTFKHALVQDVAYESLLRSRRQQLHMKIAKVLQEQFPETVSSEPELLAHHATQAGLVEKAIEYWHQAGARAYERSAIKEAISHFNKGLELLPSLPNESDHIRHELKLQTALGKALKDLKSYAHPDVEHVYGRALELCRQIGETTELFPALLGLSIFYVVRAELQSARELGEQLLSLAEGARDPVLLVEAHYALGVTHFPRGEFTAAWDHLAQGIARYDERKHRTHVALYGQDAGAVCLCRAALALWYLGYPDQAFEKGREALALAERLHHPYSQAYVQHWVTMLYRQFGIVEETGQRAAAFVAFSVEQGFPFWPPMGRVLQGWVECELGQVEDGIALMRKALRELEELGSELGKPYFLGLLADAYGKAGRADKGLVVVDQALANVEQEGQRWPEAELHRLKGELLLLTGDEGAEDSFRRALQVARHQSAKSPELRAATSLARMWRDHDRIAQARDLLAPVYAWFTEGFDTADLKEAKALLNELG